MNWDFRFKISDLDSGALYAAQALTQICHAQKSMVPTIFMLVPYSFNAR